VPRSPEQIQQEIDAARESLGATLDELSYRGSPKRLTAQGKAAALAFLQSPPGIALISAVGLTMALVVALKVKHRRDRKSVRVPTTRRR
jgi:ABC-type sugar transport system substrate-binding protein